MEKQIIWIIGSMASGKSTQRRLLCELFSTDERKLIRACDDIDEYEYTSFGAIGAPGNCKIGADNMCDGLDASFGRLKKIGSLHSVQKTIDSGHKMIIIEGSQTSVKWFEPLQEMCSKHNFVLYLIHLSLTDEQNIERLKFRQSQKIGKEVTELTEKNIESISGKNQQFRNIYNKLKDKCKSIQIDASKSIEDINDEIINFIL